ncbi:hypothetical protein PHAVU_011G197900 [Phaseolus vulgaris]|uniref:Disease resistance RPP13-like protein 1 n=1 Tax=Phaseolus vulgaris TaxID=3885 RepID=V7AJD2_PHAVU|nr:hypothetical protein PHAVU_011G197900g [Phaseolus vulgaris]ESW05649.1 hypothetical protein PHAVU_011G197900g [Phaseolus vulgaris]
MALEMFTGALVSTFVQKTIDTLASRYVDIFRARKRNKKQLSDLQMKLLSIDVVAFDAEQKQFTDPRVRDWLLRAKDVVFDAEDLLEEIDYELFKTQVEAESQSATNKVWNSLKSSFVTFFENEIESRMEQVIEDLEDLATQSDLLGLKKASGVGFGSGSSSRLTYTSLPNESVIYGRDEDREFVFNWLTSDTHNNLSILSIVGMGGLGKTSLAQHVFNDPRIEGKFDIKAWVSVLQEFDVLNVSRAILDTITGSTELSIQQEVVQRKLKEKLTGKKFLLVLHDNWNENQSKWEQVQKALGFGAQGSRLLVTTRSQNVAIAMRSEKHLLEVLRKDYCWDLFAKHAFQSVNPQPDPEFMEIGKKIVEKCNGLPLALKTMGSLLHNKSSFWEWESIMKSEIWDFSENESDILPALRLSYLHLPSHLKKCFAFCALFPKGFKIDKECLIQLWLAENFLECPLQRRSPKEVGEHYFNDLLSWSFFQESGKEEPKHFIMHDLLNDLAKFVCEDICIRLGVDEPKGIPKTSRHFSFPTIGIVHFDGFGSLVDTQKLHTFMQTDRRMYNSFFCLWHCKLSIDDLFSKFKFIRVLSLSHCGNLTEVPKSIGNLKHLRSLDLSFTDIEKLPDSISLLYKLQILKLNNCRRLMELASYLHQLDNLRCLEFINTKVKIVPANVGKLKNLQILMSSFYVEKSKEFNIQQLGELNLNGSLTIHELQNIENPSHALEGDLKNKPHLVELQLEWNIRSSSSGDSTKAGDVIENLRPSKHLKKLSVRNYVGKQLPNWLLDNLLLNLVSLALMNCKRCQRFPPLGLLPFLKKLEISGFDEIVRIDCDFHGNNSSSFKSLETLMFSFLRQWEKWECQALTGAFPCLRELSVRNCPKLKGQLPEQVVHLERLEIDECQELEGSAPKALDLELHDCGKLQLEWATVRRLTMGGHNTLDHLRESISDDYVSRCTFPLDFFQTVTTLKLSRFGNLQMISQGLIHTHLQHLEIIRCHKLESLPANMHMLLPSLRSLCIEYCPRLELFPDYGGFPSNLKNLKIRKCSRLVGSLKGALGDNPCLESLCIGEVDAECFPEEGLLPLSLTSLTIFDCQNVKKLDYKGLYQLSSLRSLTLFHCLNLQHLPEEGLSKSISYLEIRNCPLLEQRYQKEGGEDWKKIAHIQYVFILK